jgi:curved DNA-binding protein CbpA
MQAARRKSVSERRDKLRELQLRWHPDKNPNSEAEATAVFQLIQSEKGLLGL